MNITKESVLNALKQVIEPDKKKDIVSLGMVRDVKIDGNKISITVHTGNPAMHSKKNMEEGCISNLKKSLGDKIEVKVNVKVISQLGDQSGEKKPILSGVKNVIVIASGKGGVGKSTVTANLAAGLAAKGLSVGLVDADIYGPSIPLMFGIEDKKPAVIEVDGISLIEPVISYGVKIMSVGFFSNKDQAVAWRGPMASNALNQMFSDVQWGDLDYLFVDLPPGTGDIHITLVQSVPQAKAIIVSTPQPVALADARKGVAMFRLPTVNVTVLGIVENMSWFTPEELPDNKYYIFGKDGAKKLAKQLKVPFLGQIPLVQSVRESGDTGKPAILQDHIPQAKAFHKLCNKLLKQTSALAAT